MAKYVPVSKTQHANKTWRGGRDFRFAAKDRILPILSSEIPAAATEMPLGFVKAGDSFELSALVSIRANENLYVAPDGTWLVQYIPAHLRAHPFRLLKTSEPESEKTVLCVDEESDRIADGTGNEIFFDEAGEPSKVLKGVLSFLQAIEKNRIATSLAVAALHEAGLVMPWEISLHSGTAAIPIKGMYKIDATKLRDLESEAFLKLRSTGSLPIAYGQLFSMHQIATLGRLNDLQRTLREKLAQGKPSPNQINEMFKLDNNTIHF